MKSVLLMIASVVSMQTCAPAFATQVDPHTSFAPPNDLSIERFDDPAVDSISHAQFDQAIDLVYNYYAPIMKKQGWTLQFKRLWSDPTVNSDTYHSGNVIVINSYGGLARYAGMNTVEAYAGVACHELGHTAGGAPRFSDDPSMSVEGQADRFAYQKCMKAIGFAGAAIVRSYTQLSCVLASLEGSRCPTGKEVLQPYPGIEEDHPPAACRYKEYAGASTGKRRKRCWYNP
jgi:hypothetical protein